MAFERAASSVRLIARNTARFDDIRDLGRRVELLDTLWWPSDNTANAGDMLLWQTVRQVPEDPPPVVPFLVATTLRYKRVNRLYRRAEDSQELLPTPALVLADGVAFTPFIEPGGESATRVNAQRISERLFLFAGEQRQGGAGAGGGGDASPSPSSAASPAAIPVLGREDSLSAVAVYQNPRRGDTSSDPFDRFQDSWAVVSPPTVFPVIYTVTHATGRWRGATNVVVGYVATRYEQPWEISVVRGMRE